MAIAAYLLIHFARKQPGSAPVQLRWLAMLLLWGLSQWIFASHNKEALPRVYVDVLCRELDRIMSTISSGPPVSLDHIVKG